MLFLPFRDEPGILKLNCREKWDTKTEVVELDGTWFFVLQGKDGSRNS